MTGCTREPRPRRRAFLVAVLLSASLLLADQSMLHQAQANPGNYPVSFYFHNQSTKTIDTISTTLWANASQSWSSATQTENRGVRNGMPGQWDFYSEPALAGNLTLSSPTVTHLWISASATLSGAGLSATLFSVAPWGAKTTIATVTTTQTIGTGTSEYVLTLGSLSSNTVPSGYLLNLEAILTTTSATLRTATISYDTALLPDRISLTFVDHFSIQSVAYYNASLVPMTSFSRNWTTPQRQVIARANVSDSLGLYQISGVAFTVVNPSGAATVNNASMTMISGGNSSYWGLWELSFPYSSSDPSGTYLGAATGYDQSGNLKQSLLFSFRIFAAWNITISVQSSPFNSSPLQNVLLTAVDPTGLVWSGTTTAQGTADGLLEDGRRYNITAIWEGTAVATDDNISIIAPTLLNLTARVHFLSLSGIFQDSIGRPLNSVPSSLSMTAPNGTRITPDPAGSYFLQDGNFQVSDVTWKGINVAPAGSQFNPGNLSPIRLNVFDLSLAAVQQDSSGLAGAKVTLVSDNIVVATGTTDSSGIAFFRQLPGGDYVITLQSPQGQATKSLTLDRTLTTQIQVSPTPPAPFTMFDLYLFSIVVSGSIATLGGFFGLRKSGVLKFNEHGFEYLNDIVGGKIPQPASLLVSGDAGSGKTLFCEQLAADWLGKDNPVIFMSYQNSPDQTRKSMSSLRIDAKSFENRAKLALVDCYSSPAKIKSAEKYLLENPFDLTALGIKLSQALKDLGEKAPLLIIDPISALFNKVPPSVVVGFLEDKASRIKGLGGDAVFALGKGTASKEALGSIEAAADGIIDLSMIQDKKGLVRSLRVRKMRNQAFNEASFDFKIRAPKGIRFLTKRF
jgi:KaiC/GvpD/RAD55 family RecA-like ATPase